MLVSGVQVGVNELGSSRKRGGFHSTEPVPKTSSWTLLPIQVVLSGDMDTELVYTSKVNCNVSEPQVSETVTEKVVV